MSIFIQEVLGLLKRNQKKITLDKTKDWFEFGKLYQSSALNTGASYNPKMDPFVIKWGDLVCQATEDLTRTLPGEGNLGFIPVYTDPSGFCSWDTLKDSIITQNALNTIINIAGNLVVTGDLAVNGCDLTSTCIAFNLLNQPTTITFGSGAANIFIGKADPTSTVTIVGTQDSNACTNGALVVNGGVGIAKNLNVCGIVSISNTTQSTSCTTGALVVAGGVGIAKNLFVCGNATITGDAAINGGDLTSTASSFQLLQQSTTISFGYNSQQMFVGGLSATSTVIINSIQDSTSCTTGALVVNGGVGIAKNLFVCGTTNLNGTVNLGDALTDEIYLNGQLLDNNGNFATVNQVLIGQTGGSALWTSPPWITSFTIAGDTVGTFNITQGNTLSILGGTAINTALSTVDTVTINHDDYGTPGTYAYPSSITTNAQGHVISITAGTGAVITANNGLTMNPATNVQLGGTLIQDTTINNSTFDFIVSRTNSGTAIQGINYSSGRGVVGISITGVGVTGTSQTFRAGQFSISPVSDNTVAENTIFQRIVTGNAPANDGIGQSLVFENAIKSGSLASANTLISKFTSTADLARTSEFSITGVNAGVTGNKLILSGNGTLGLPDYGVGNKPGTAAYNLSVTSTGNVIETGVPNYSPQVYASMLTQSGTVNGPSTVLIFNNIADSLGVLFTFTWSRISAGLYELTCNQPIFGAKAAIFATPDINSRVYCIALERIVGDATRMRLNSFNPTTGNSEDNLLDNATFKIEYYQ